MISRVSQPVAAVIEALPAATSENPSLKDRPFEVVRDAELREAHSSLAPQTTMAFGVMTYLIQKYFRQFGEEQETLFDSALSILARAFSKRANAIFDGCRKEALQQLADLVAHESW